MTDFTGQYHDDDPTNVRQIESAFGHPLFGYEETPESDDLDAAEELHLKIWLAMAEALELAIWQVEIFIKHQRIVASTAEARAILQSLKEQQSWVEEQRKTRI